MSPFRDDQHFNEYRDWQWCKHVALRDYVLPWSEIVGKYSKEIVAVDCHAGAGSYLDPTTRDEVAEGSPIIFAKQAAAYTAKHGPGRSMHVICVEKNESHFETLTERIQPYRTHTTLLQGSLAEHVPAIAERLGNTPALILLDPIGVKSIIPADWEPLLTRTAKTDLFITLHFAYVHRTGGMLRANGSADPNVKGAAANAAGIDRFFRGAQWRSIATDLTLQVEERERCYVALYFDQVIGARHRWKCQFAVRARASTPVKYWLVQASSDRKPYMLMNDEIVKLNEMLIERDYGQDGTLEGFAADQVEAHRTRLRREIEAATLRQLSEAAAHKLPFGAIRDQLVGTYFGLVKGGVYGDVIKGLVTTHSLVREQQRAKAKLEENEMISLAGAPAGDDGAKVIPLRRQAA